MKSVSDNHYSMNEKKNPEKIFAVGDIHGCFERLVRLIDRIHLDEKSDTIVFLGDYINRGPQSREVLDYLIGLKKRCAKSVFIMGNHEHLLLRYAETGDPDMLQQLRWLGIEDTLASYNKAPIRSLLNLSFMPIEHREFLMELTFAYRSPPYLFVHSEVVDGNPSPLTTDNILESRRLTMDGDLDLDSIVVFGHTSFKTPFVAPDRIGIDTGAVHGNVLTAVELPSMRFFHA
jgi:serine/threonine protein phosphatase 1